MTTRTIANGDVQLAAQDFGDPADPCVLLVMGAMASMLWWPEDMCLALARGGRHVIRYDNRDTGLSTRYPLGKPSYTMKNMAEDAAAVLDGHGVDKAHVVGMSMGGIIAQIMALSSPSRVRSLTLISTTPMGMDTSDLPQMSDAYKAHAASSEQVDWTDNAQVIDFLARDAAALAGTAHPHVAGAARSLIEADVSRSGSFASAVNHFSLEAGGDWAGQLSGMDKPALVIHGAADPIFPVEHGMRLAETIPGAEFLAIAGGGHELHEADAPLIVEAILRKTG